MQRPTRRARWFSVLRILPRFCRSTLEVMGQQKAQREFLESVAASDDGTAIHGADPASREPLRVVSCQDGVATLCVDDRPDWFNNLWNVRAGKRIVASRPRFAPSCETSVSRGPAA